MQVVIVAMRGRGGYCIVKMIGRDKTNPNHRGRVNENYEQRLEPNTKGLCNSLTTLQKDNLVLEVCRSGK